MEWVRTLSDSAFDVFVDWCVVRRSENKERMWKQVEAALSSLTAKELLSALCAHADETATALSQKTAAIDIAKDAEKLRYGICV